MVLPLYVPSSLYSAASIPSCLLRIASNAGSSSPSPAPCPPSPSVCTIQVMLSVGGSVGEAGFKTGGLPFIREHAMVLHQLQLASHDG